MESVLKETGFFKSFDDETVYYESRGSGDPMFSAMGLVVFLTTSHLK
jgi:hypothetical protein